VLTRGVKSISDRPKARVTSGASRVAGESRVRTSPLGDAAWSIAMSQAFSAAIFLSSSSVLTPSWWRTICWRSMASSIAALSSTTATAADSSAPNGSSCGISPCSAASSGATTTSGSGITPSCGRFTPNQRDGAADANRVRRSWATTVRVGIASEAKAASVPTTSPAKTRCGASGA
jgi:hypothetical protein